MPSRTLLTKTSQLLYGGDYNPEQWPESVWEEDMRLMKEAGVNLVSIGIFSWAKLQPTEKTYTFEWLDRLMDLLAENGIWADLATATASPPPWMSLHPDLLAVDADGRILHHGSRQHYSPSSPTYRKFAHALVEKIASRYAKHPALAAWHINNEYACHVPSCHSEASTDAFRRWLQRRYGTIDALNVGWGTAFWSQQYSEWNEVFTPRKTPTFQNPCQALDFQRFSSDALLELYKMEHKILREATPDLPITTNFMGFFKPLDYWEWAKELDFTSWDSYPDPLPDQQGKLMAAAGHDLTRSLKPGRPFLLMEQVTSHVNWRPVNATKAPGLMRLWSLQSIARGSDGVLFFQWRQSLAGAEKFHGAMVQHAPSQKSRVFREVCELGAELKKLAPVAGSVIKSRIGILLDWNVWWALELPSKPAEFRYMDMVMPFHRYCYERNLAVDFLHPSSNLDAYSLVIAPTLYLLNKNDAANLELYVSNGGTLLVTSFSGIVDDNDRVIPGGYPGYLREVLGIWVEEWFPLGESERRSVEFREGGRTAKAKNWCEIIHLEGAQPLATFTEDYLENRPVLTSHRFGSGSAFYLGTQFDDSALFPILDNLCKELSLEPILDAPDGVEVTLRESEECRFLFILNHLNDAVRISLASFSGVNLLTGKSESAIIDLPPHEVAILNLSRPS